jgi:hypothetical protein
MYQRDEKKKGQHLTKFVRLIEHFKCRAPTDIAM